MKQYLKFSGIVLSLIALLLIGIAIKKIMPEEGLFLRTVCLIPFSTAWVYLVKEIVIFK